MSKLGGFLESGLKVVKFRGKLVKVIKLTGETFDDYSISPKIRQILLHWVYELTFLMICQNNV